MTEPANRHQHDDQLLPPFRWLTRAMSSWWLVGGMGLIVLLYLAAVYVPLGSRYLWQQRWIDVAQVQMTRWVPLHVAMLMLAVAVVWATLRRVAWRPRNLGAFVAAAGVAVVLFGVSFSLRYGVHGMVVVPPSDNSGLVLTTRYADPVERVLVVQFGPNPPFSVPLGSLPRWNDVPPAADLEGPLNLPLHVDPELGRQLDYRARLTIVGYLAAGELQDHPDGSTSAQSVPADARDADAQYLLPQRAMLAVRVEGESADGRTSRSLIWLPFEPGGIDRLMPTQRYEVPGLGSVGLAFRPVGRDLPFGLAMSGGGSAVTLHIAETNPATNQLMPMTRNDQLMVGDAWSYEPLRPGPGMSRIALTPLYPPELEAGVALDYVRLSSSPGRVVVIIGLSISAGGLVLWGIGGLISVRRRAATRLS